MEKKTSTEFKQWKKNEIEKQVKQLLAALTDEVVVMANIVCDFDQETIASVKYETPIEDSDTGLLISNSTLKETMENMDYGTVPGTDANQGAGAVITSTGTGGSYSKTDITSNYQLNEESRETIKGLGNIDPEKSSITVSFYYGKEITEAPDEDSMEKLIFLQDVSL